MTSDWEMYRASADVAVTGVERLGLWPIFPFYEVSEAEDDTFAVAPRNVPNDHPMVHGAVRDQRRVTYPPSREKAVKFVNTPRYYAPLEEHPDLFARFARLGDQTRIPVSTWLEWLHEYGVLGIRDLQSGRNDIEEAYSDFVHEVLLADRTLRLFEAATNPEGPNVEIIQELRPEGNNGLASSDPEELERVTLYEVRNTVKQKVQADCYWDLLTRDSSWRGKSRSPLARKWVFRSLLGSLWLQFMWLVTFDDLRFCAAPRCITHISPYARPDKTTCSPRCRKSLERSRKSGRS